MATTSTMDDLTAGAIREAVAAAAAGRLSDACAVGEKALAQGGDQAALNAMLGMLHAKSGNASRAVGHLQAANNARPEDPVIANNLAKVLMELERNAEALQVLTDLLVETDRTGQLLRLRAFLAQISEQFEIAVQDYERIVGHSPRDCEAWNNLGNARRGLGDFDGAIQALRQAAKLEPGSAPIRMNLASALIGQGNWQVAEEELWRIAKDFPADPNPLSELHIMLKEQGRNEEALEVIDQAIERAPDDLTLLLGKAGHLSFVLDSASAEAAYRRVLDLDANNALAHLGLATCFDLTNRTQELAGLVLEAERRDVGANALNFIRAYDHRRAKRYSEGLSALEQVPDDLETSRRSNLMGQLLEGVGRYDEAFAAYSRMNELNADKHGPQPEARATNYRNIMRERHETTTRDWVGRWRPEEKGDPRPAPVFLVGFPRSGTTLLDTMLMGHPQIEVLEEEPTLHPALEILREYETLPEATDEQVAAARDGYFDVAKSLTPLRAGNLLIDKNPLAMNAVPFIRRIFPDTRIILALRHPCDVVLSCYVTNFRLNDGMASFASLDTAAELYDISFSYFERVQELMPTPTHTVMYEKVVADQDRELRALFDFLELDWHDAVLDHQKTALGRGRIKTASYAQVSEPLYKRSAGRWQNFRKHLEPIIPVLRPWIDKFGYEV